MERIGPNPGVETSLCDFPWAPCAGGMHPPLPSPLVSSRRVNLKSKATPEVWLLLLRGV